MLERERKAVKQIVNEGLRKLAGVLERVNIALFHVEVVFNCFDNVAIAHGLHHFLRNNNVIISYWLSNVTQSYIILFLGRRMSELSLIVRYGPFGGVHNS